MEQPTLLFVHLQCLTKLKNWNFAQSPLDGVPQGKNFPIAQQRNNLNYRSETSVLTFLKDWSVCLRKQLKK